MDVDGPRNRGRRPTLYGNDLDNFEELPPTVVEPATAGHMDSEEFEGDYGGKFGKKNKNTDGPGLTKRFFGGVTGVIKKGKGDGVNTSVRELVVYFLFLIIICFVVFSSASSSTFYFTQAMSTLFVNSKGEGDNQFADVATMDDIWNYLNNQLMDGLYWETFSDNDNVNTTEKSMVYYENRLLGKPRIRQLRVTNHSCNVVEQFSREIKECYNQYSVDKEDRSGIEITDINMLETEADFSYFEWQDAESLSTRDLWGQLATYSGGGYVALLDLSNSTVSKQIIDKLKQNRWINRGTRAVVVDFSVYNANINLFCVAQLIFEIPATGGVIATSKFESLRLIRYVTAWDHVILVLEGIFTGFIIYFFIEEVIEIVKHRLRYFRSFWNIIDLVVISLSVTCMILNFHRTSISDKTVTELVENDLEYASLDDVLVSHSNYTNVSSVLMFFAWIKIFKYISINKTMSQLSATLSRSAKDIGSFAVMFFVFFFAYAQFGYLCFGTQIQDYSTFYSSVFALLRTILGDFDFHALEKANRVLGPTFFITYVFFVFFVLLNMFLAIINDTYVEVKQELARQKNDFEVADFFKSHFYRVLGFMRLTKKTEPSEEPDYGLWKEELIKRGFSNEEINDKFVKYDVADAMPYDKETADQIEKDLEDDKEEREKKQNEHRDLIVVNRRIQQIDMKLCNVDQLARMILNRLELIETDKVEGKDIENQMTAQGALFQIQNVNPKLNGDEDDDGYPNNKEQ